MYELNAFNAHASFVNVTTPINGDFFSRMKTEDELGKYPQQTSKGEVSIEECLARL